MSLSDVFAGLALILSIYSIFSTRKLNKLQGKVLTLEHDLNSILLEKEKNDLLNNKRAKLSANKIMIGTDRTRLKIYNMGGADAYNVRVTYPDDLKNFIRDDIFPLEKLNSMQASEVGVMVYGDFPNKSLIKIIWDDEFQNDNANEVMVTW